jgi:hypothetical protein
MKIDIENLKAQMTGRELNIYQIAKALREFNKLLDYVNELEQLTIPVVVEQSEQLLCKHCDNKKALHSRASGLCPNMFKHFEAK